MPVLNVAEDATHTLLLPAPVNPFVARTTGPEVVAEIDRLLDDHTYRAIAQALNQRGFRSGSGKPFDPVSVGLICTTRGLKSRYDRLRARGLLTLQEIATRLQVGPDTVRTWHHHALLRAHACNDVHACLYEVPDPRLPPKSKGVKLEVRKANIEKVETITHEVQCEV